MGRQLALVLVPEDDGGRWAGAWHAATPVAGPLCRGCIERAAIRRGVRNRVASQIRGAQLEVRETTEGVYCAACFAALSACPHCGMAPSSHPEYACAACEARAAGRAFLASGGRTQSPTYRGWSTRYKDSGVDTRERHGRRTTGY